MFALVVSIFNTLENKELLVAPGQESVVFPLLFFSSFISMHGPISL